MRGKLEIFQADDLSLTVYWWDSHTRTMYTGRYATSGHVACAYDVFAAMQGTISTEWKESDFDKGYHETYKTCALIVCAHIED